MGDLLDSNLLPLKYLIIAICPQSFPKNKYGIHNDIMLIGSISYICSKLLCISSSQLTGLRICESPSVMWQSLKHLVSISKKLKYLDLSGNPDDHEGTLEYIAHAIGYDLVLKGI